MKVINYLNNIEIGFSVFENNHFTNGDRRNGFVGTISLKDGVLHDKLEYEGLNDYEQEKLIKKELPEFYKICEEKDGNIRINTNELPAKDIILFYEAISYAGKKGKQIIIN